ncbi:ADP-ribose pyrophosphatase [Breznakia sp. PF5-3]|uniref:NUDIX hydrolase n=1 Tax=unclassified Breznakia TaxID=2623764 RepID=UPI002405D90B|nr:MULTISPECIES: NUDIX hydrolase [unclassified Breznakia]MDL2276104.1 NUDIX hydrolase [Breznakia sp. OttesenSCG-928-G09]MDF9823872.1 ADP-ribose pyrophosphatase [Breznakia sp. PM6-1]MDF9834671.1 ADP-ribose pyrophosphatase [Breznakia sp. PF5-3]MDF9836894.1 ADP-ribose pyrophosphatase [Breznakia sp. PFB2-8]MDF9858911.1 ADP-ribose pyrophosphatase [Breznakia sp. PH5-24]
MKEKTLHSECVYDGKIIQVDRDEVSIDGKMTIREVVHNSGGVSVLAITEEQEVILVKQYRYPSKEELYEIAGGKQNPNETFIEAGMRELKEETGYISKDTHYFGYLYPSVAYVDEVIHLVVAKNCIYQEKQLDDGEYTETVVLPLEEVLKMIQQNKIKDAKTIVAILKYVSFLNYK